jgi:hypothetical protein
VTVFARAATIIAAEVDVDDILTRGADPGQNGAQAALAVEVVVIASTYVYAWNNVCRGLEVPPSGQLKLIIF